MEPTSSASPAALAHYGRAGADVGARAAAEAARLDAALAAYFARCREYSVHGLHGLVGRLGGYGRHEAELAAWTATIADGFRRADAGASPTLIGPPPPPRRRDVLDPASARWNREARSLIRDVRLLRWSLMGGGRDGLLRLLPFVMPSVLLSLEGIALLSKGRAAPRDGDAAGLTRLEALSLALHGFWRESMAHLEPEVFRELSAELDALSLALAMDGLIPWPEPGAQAGAVRDPRTGALTTTAAQAFPWSTLCREGLDAPFHPSPADALAGQHGGISYLPQEQVLLERTNEEEYRVSIAGLDPTKPGAPNNLEAVALTAQGVREGNHYYEVVKARFLESVRQIPPGSTLHMQGHSMGGGMCFLLRDDPEVRQALAAGGIVVGSLITYGAVRPQGPAGASREEEDEASPFAGLEERHYVNLDDSLALNVGAGHAEDPHVITLANGTIDEPSQAHNAYGEADSYAGLAPELLALPYLVDPQLYEVVNPAVSIAWPGSPGPAPVPAPTPLPAAPPASPQASERARVSALPPMPTPTPTPAPELAERSPYVAP